jgi:hypothetical protein
MQADDDNKDLSDLRRRSQITLRLSVSLSVCLSWCRAPPGLMTNGVQNYPEAELQIKTQFVARSKLTASRL